MSQYKRVVEAGWKRRHAGLYTQHADILSVIVWKKRGNWSEIRGSLQAAAGKAEQPVEVRNPQLLPTQANGALVAAQARCDHRVRHGAPQRGFLRLPLVYLGVVLGNVQEDAAGLNRQERKMRLSRRWCGGSAGRGWSRWNDRAAGFQPRPGVAAARSSSGWTRAQVTSEADALSDCRRCHRVDASQERAKQEQWGPGWNRSLPAARDGVCSGETRGPRKGLEA